MDSDITEKSANVLTSTMGSVLSNSNETNENPPAVDSLPSSSSDASNVDLSVRKKLPDDPISSTSDMGDGQFDRNNDISLPMNEPGIKVTASRSDIDNDDDLFANECNLSHITTEKITENVEDIVSDLENLLGNSTDDFPIRKSNSNILDPDLDDDLLFSMSSFSEKKTDKPSISDNLQRKKISVTNVELGTISEVATGSVGQISTRDITKTLKVEEVLSANKEKIGEVILNDDLKTLTAEKSNLKDLDVTDKISQTTSQDNLTTNKDLKENDEEKSIITFETTETLETSKTVNILTDVQMRSSEDIQGMEVTETVEGDEPEVFDEVQNNNEIQSSLIKGGDLIESVGMNVEIDKKIDEQEVYEAMETDKIEIEGSEKSADVEEVMNEDSETKKIEDDDKTHNDLNREEETQTQEAQSTENSTETQIEIQDEEGIQIEDVPEKRPETAMDVPSKHKIQIEILTTENNKQINEEKLVLDSGEETCEKKILETVTEQEENDQVKNIESMIIDKIETSKFEEVTESNIEVKENTFVKNTMVLSSPESIDKVIESKECKTKPAESTTKDEQPVIETSPKSNKFEDIELMECETENSTLSELEVDTTKTAEKNLLNNAYDEVLVTSGKLIKVNSDVDNKESERENITEAVDELVVNEIDSNKNMDLMECSDVEIDDDKKEEQLNFENKRDSTNDVSILAVTSEAKIESAHIESETCSIIVRQEVETRDVIGDDASECSQSILVPEDIQVIDNVKDPDSSMKDDSDKNKENFNITEEMVDEIHKEEMETNLDVHKELEEVLEKETVESECTTSKIDDNASTVMETEENVNTEENVKTSEVCIEPDHDKDLAEKDSKNIVVEDVEEKIAVDNNTNEECNYANPMTDKVLIQSEKEGESVKLVPTNDSKEENIKEEDSKLDGGIEEQTINSLGEEKETLGNINLVAISEHIAESTELTTLDNTENISRDCQISKHLKDNVSEISDNIQVDVTVQAFAETESVGPQTICKDNEVVELEKSVVEETKLDTQTMMESQCVASISFSIQERSGETKASLSKELTNTESDNLKQSEIIKSDALDKIVRESKNSILLPISQTINDAVESAMQKVKSGERYTDGIYDILPESTCESSNTVDQQLAKEASVERINTCEPMEINDDISIENKVSISEVASDIKRDSSKLEKNLSENIADVSRVIEMEKNDIEKKNIADETEKNKSLLLEVSSTNNFQASKELSELQKEDFIKPNETINEETELQKDVQEDENATNSESQSIKSDCDINTSEDLCKDTLQDVNLEGKFVDNEKIETTNLVETGEICTEKLQIIEDQMEVDTNKDLTISDTYEICKQSDTKNTKTNEESKSKIIEGSPSADMANDIFDSVNSITENVGFDSQDHQEINVDSSNVDFEPEVQPSENKDLPKSESLLENILETNIESENLNFNEQLAPVGMEIDDEINDEDELVKAALEASTSTSKDIMEVTTCNDQSNEHPDFSNDNDLLKAAEDAINRDKQESEEYALIQAALESQNRENDEQILIKAAADAQNNVVSEEAKKNAEEAERKDAEAARKTAEAERKAIEAAEKKTAEIAAKRASEAAEKKAAEAAKKRAEEKKAAEAAEKKAAEAAEKKAAEVAEKKAAEVAEKKAAEAAKKKAKEAAEKRATEVAEKKAIEAAEKKAVEAAEKKAIEAAEKKAVEAAERKAVEAAEKKAVEAAEKKAAEVAQKKAVEAKKKAAECEKKTAEAEKKAAEAAEKKAAEIEAEKMSLEINKAKNIEGYKMPLNIVVDTLPSTSISVIKEAESTTNEDTEMCQKEVSSDEDKQAEYSSKISQNQELKLTIRKNKAEEPSSILKIYDPKNPNIIEISPSESETEPEETPIPKFIIKQSQCSPKVLSPLKITIKPVMKTEEQQAQKSSPKLIIKPIVKPEDEVKHIEEKHHSPKITIKPIIKPSDDSERCNSPKITIKPIIKPPEASTSPKIKIKPILKPEEIKDEEEDETKERIVLKINKNNISHKDVKKIEEKETEKLAKIKLKFSKEGRHAHIVNEEMMEVEQKLSTKRHNLEEVEMEIKKQKLDVNLSEHIPKETLNPENINIPGPSQLEAIVIEDSLEASVIDLPPEALPVVAPTPRRRGRPRKVPLEVREEFKDPKENLPAEGLRVETATETASGRPKRSCRGPSVRTTLGIKPRKPRGAGRGRGGRGRGAAAAAAAAVETVATGIRAGRVEKELKKEKITESKLKLLKEAAITAQVAESLENQDVEMKVEEIESISIVDVPEEKLRSLAKSKTIPEEPKLQPSDVVMYEEETRMSAETNSRAQTPAKQVVVAPDLVLVVEESQSSVQSTATTESVKARKNPRSEIQLDPDGPVVSADQLAEYYWNGAGPYMLQEQVAQFLGIKSFKRKYPGIQRRPVDMQERDFIRESGLTSEHMCDLGLTAVNSADILDIMYSDFQNKYEEYCKYQRDRQTKDITNKQKALSLAASQEKNKLDIMQQAVESAAQWNVGFNKSRRDDRRACMDLQTYTINYPKGRVKHISKPKIGNYPIALVPGQYTDYFKTYTATELNNLPLNTMLYHPINLHNEEDSQSDGSGSETDSSSSGSSSDSDSSEEDCNICTPPVGLKKAVV